MCRRSSRVSSSGSSPVVAAAWLISARRLSATARRVQGRRRGFSTFRAGVVGRVDQAVLLGVPVQAAQRGDEVLGGAAPAAARTLPLPVPPACPPALPRDVVYGLARVDRSGRVADRTVTGALGWRGGDRLALTAEAGVVVIRRDPSGLVTLPPRSCVPIPAALRHRCGLLPGHPVLLTAVPAEDTLTAYSLAVVDQALTALIPFPHVKEATDDDHRT